MLTGPNGNVAPALDFSSYLDRYSCGGWRTPIFRDLILSDAKRLQQEDEELVFLDIGCGGGFDCDVKQQTLLAEASSQYIGVEPDADIHLSDIYAKTYRCRFEDAPISADSVDIAFAVMVLEHIADQTLFWNKVHTILKPGGVFWGFTVDARHPFVIASLLMEKFNIKDWYLNLLHGTRGKERYENYNVYYRCNTPEQINQLTQYFKVQTILNFHRVGQLDYYFPDKLKWIGRIYDKSAIKMRWPGSILAVRVEK